MPLRTLVRRIKYDAVAVAVADGKTFIRFTFFGGTVANREVYETILSVQ